MKHDPPKHILLKELESLRQEIGELRSIESMHQKAQEGLRDIELQLAGIIHSAMDGIVTINEKQEIVLFNAAAEQMFGCSAIEALGQSINRFIPERYRKHHANHVKSFGATRVTNRRMGALGSISGIRSNGEEFPIEASISQVKRGKHRLYTVILRDITERRQLEAQLSQTERLAELGTLAAGMAHEIGTPMNVILGRAEYLMRKTSEETTKKGLATIVTQVERITKIMNQLLSFARRRPIERRPLVLANVVHDILDVVQDRLKRRDITLELRLDSNCSTVFADRDQMGQVILNLVMNAIQAMPKGGTLGVRLTCEKKLAHLSISDTGCGIPKENLAKLFTPFFTTKEVGEGTGLGLTVVHGIIQEHEGTIQVDSQEGQGSTFTISFPSYQPAKHSI